MALAVLGLVMSAVLRVYGTGVLSVGRGVDDLRLALAAEAVLTRTRLDLDPRQRRAEGQIDGIDWQMVARPMPIPRPSLPASGASRAGASGAGASAAGASGTAPPDRRLRGWCVRGWCVRGLRVCPFVRLLGNRAAAKHGTGQSGATGAAAVGGAGHRRRCGAELRAGDAAMAAAHMSRLDPRKGQAGFTLVELLVAMAIMGLVMLLVTQGLRYATTARERMLARSDGLQDLVLGRELLQRQLSRAQWLAWGDAGKKRIAFSGDAERIRFVNVAPDYLPGEAWQLWEFALEPTPRGGRELLVRHAAWDRAQPGFTPLEQARPRVLATIDAPLGFTFFAKTGATDRGRWLDRWVELQKLPLAVRMAGGGMGWPELVVRPEIELGARCAAEDNEETVGCGG